MGQNTFGDYCSINDECKLYYSGDKSLEETVKVIQNRAQIYMNENQGD